MVNNLFILAVSLFLVIKGATLATKYASRLAESFQLSKYTVGFIIVAVISILPETFISLDAALRGIPDFGLGLLFGSNIADLTLVFAVIIFLVGRGLKVESKILKNHSFYPFILLIPLFLGFDGYFSRLEGAALIIAGVIFYCLAFKRGLNAKRNLQNKPAWGNSLLIFVVSFVFLLGGAHFTVISATVLADYLGFNQILISMLVVGLGTTMPELFFALKSIRNKDDSLAIGDILGTVLADATIVVGLIALVNPFAFPQKIIYITGLFMVLASFLLFRFMRTGRNLSKKEAYLLLIFWLAFVVVELIANR